jgi:hypothetical protein
MMDWRAVLLLVSISGLLLGGCASQKPQAGAESADGAKVGELGDEDRWWHVRFRFHRPGLAWTDSYLDGLVAVEVIAPVLAQREREMRLWRFHRRWAEDSVGHQFSFMFFAQPATARAVEQQLQRTPLLTALKDEGYLRDWFIEQPPPAEAVVPGSTSDDRWPLALQHEWPHFIMGSSRMWLGLLQDASMRNHTSGLHRRYRQVQQEIDELWFNEANHALFHHLSALFGYRPLRVRGGEAMRF